MSAPKTLRHEELHIDDKITVVCTQYTQWFLTMISMRSRDSGYSMVLIMSRSCNGDLNSDGMASRTITSRFLFMAAKIEIISCETHVIKLQCI